MTERNLEFRVGLLILVTAVVTVTLIWVLGSFSFASGYTIAVDYNFSGNIKPGAPVKLAGIKVGKVQDVQLLPQPVDDNSGRRVFVRLDVWIENQVKENIRRDSDFFVNTSGVLGEQYLEIVPSQDPSTPVLEAGSVVRGIDPPRTDLIVSRLYTVLDSLSQVLTEDQDFIRKLIQNGAGTAHELNQLLKNNQQELAALITSANSLANEGANTLETLNQGLSPQSVQRSLRVAQTLLSTAENSLATLTPSAKAFLDDATRTTEMVTEQRVDQVLLVADEAAALGKETRMLVSDLHTITSNILNGKGTVGALLVRNELYADLREMLRDLKKNPWKFFWKE